MIEFDEGEYSAFLEHEVRRGSGLSVDEFVRRYEAGELDGAILTSAISPACCGSTRTAIEPPRRVARAFPDYLNSVLNRTVTDARLTLLPIPGRETHGVLSESLEVFERRPESIARAPATKKPCE